MEEPVTLLACVGHPRTKALVERLTGRGGYRVVGRVTSPAAALTAVRNRSPHVVVADLVRVEQLEALAHLLQQVPTVVVSAVRAEFALMPCLAAGARGYVAAPAHAEVLDQAVLSVAGGGMYVDPACTELVVRLAVAGRMARPAHGLTLRQLQVLHLAEEGLTNREIAESLGISQETVKSHLHQAMRRLGVHGRLAAAARAVRPERLRRDDTRNT